MKNLTRNEVPNTRAEFLKKWKEDKFFRSRALNMGFNVVMDCVILPNGMIAGHGVK